MQPTDARGEQGLESGLQFAEAPAAVIVHNMLKMRNTAGSLQGCCAMACTTMSSRQLDPLDPHDPVPP